MTLENTTTFGGAHRLTGEQRCTGVRHSALGRGLEGSSTEWISPHLISNSGGSGLGPQRPAGLVGRHVHVPTYDVICTYMQRHRMDRIKYALAAPFGSLFSAQNEAHCAQFLCPSKRARKPPHAPNLLYWLRAKKWKPGQRGQPLAVIYRTDRHGRPGLPRKRRQ
eukprot:EG_transcript_15769